ncbi:hypothetical protein [Streptomyces nogalater]|uniref:Uncharacterized protein n=1 Tax=Streptomyces nogalater TaxID=38314 RepID=A0ABW0WHM3_STRNO
MVEAIRRRFVKELRAGNYLPVDRQELLRRLTERNQREDAKSSTALPC